MALIADGLMVAASLVAAIYCMVLAARVRRLKDLDRGLGAAIAQLSHQVDGMQSALGEAKRVSGASVRELRELTARAEMAAGRLELLLAALHDRDGARPLDRRPPRPAARREAAERPEAPRPGAAAGPAPAMAAPTAESSPESPPESPRLDSPRPESPAAPADANEALRRRLRALFGAPAA